MQVPPLSDTGQFNRKANKIQALKLRPTTRNHNYLISLAWIFPYILNPSLMPFYDHKLKKKKICERSNFRIHVICPILAQITIIMCSIMILQCHHLITKTTFCITPLLNWSSFWNLSHGIKLAPYLQAPSTK